MANNLKTAVARRNAALDNILGNANSGILRIYDGTQPANADTAVSTQVVLAELTMNVAAFGAASSGAAVAAAITNDASANASGTASWFRLFKSDGTTAIMDGTVGVSGCDMNINSVAISSGAIISVSSFTVTFPA